MVKELWVTMWSRNKFYILCLDWLRNSMDPFFVGIWGPNLRFGDQILRLVDQKKLKIFPKID